MPDKHTKDLSYLKKMSHKKTLHVFTLFTAKNGKNRPRECVRMSTLVKIHYLFYEYSISNRVFFQSVLNKI